MPFSWLLAQGVHVEVGVDELLGDVADHDHARVRPPAGSARRGSAPAPTMESRSATDLIVAEVGDDHPPGVDADPDLGGHAEAALEVGAGVAHRHDEVEPGEHRPAGVVLVRVGVAEAGEDAVARSTAST